MGTAQPAAAKAGRFIAGDPLRALACLGILVWHVIVNAAALTPPAGVSPYYQAELGFLGRPLYNLSFSVWLFFALSGFLIGGPFVRAIVRGGDRPPRVMPYLRNRVLRIVPAFWAFLTLTILVAGTEGDGARHIAAFYGFVHIYSYGPFAERMVQAWTLDVEAVFYVAVPLLLLPIASLLRNRWTPSRRAAVIVAGCAVAAAASLAMGERFGISGRTLPASAWAFTPGIALAALEPLIRPRVEGRASARSLGWLSLGAAIGAFLAASYLVSFASNVGQNALALITIGCLLAAPLLLQWSTGTTTRLLDNRVLRWVGKRAYGIYLAHVLVIHELRHMTATLPSERAALVTTLPLVLAISLALGAFSYRFVERPFLDRRAPWRTPEPQAPTNAATAAPALQPALQQP